jgi:hypothetical protein
VPDVDTQLTRALETVAEEGRAGSRSAAASSIRSIAKTRSRRRRALISLTTAAAIVAGIGIVTQGPFGGDDTVRVSVPATNNPATDGSPLLTAHEVGESLGTMWPWQAGPVDPAPGKVTPCQGNAAAADPARTAAQARVVTGGWSGDDTVTELVEESASVDAAKAAFDRAVAWFTECGGQGVDQSDVQGSLAKRFEAAVPIAADQSRVVVRMREHLGGESWSNTVAGVIRVGLQVAVVAWDNTIDDNPGAYDDGFVQLVKVAAARLRGESLPAVPDAALLQPDDAAVHVLTHGDNAATNIADTAPLASMFCNGKLDKHPSKLVAGRSMATFGKDQSAGIVETVLLFDTESAAEAAVQNYRDQPTSCAGTESSTLDVGGDWPGGATEARQPGLGGHDYSGAVQSGRAVAYVGIEQLQKPLNDDQARAVFEKAAQRLSATYG